MEEGVRMQATKNGELIRRSAGNSCSLRAGRRLTTGWRGIGMPWLVCGHGTP